MQEGCFQAGVTALAQRSFPEAQHSPHTPHPQTRTIHSTERPVRTQRGAHRADGACGCVYKNTGAISVSIIKSCHDCDICSNLVFRVHETTVKKSQYQIYML